MAEHAAGLLQDLGAVSDEEEARLVAAGPFPLEALVVEGRDRGLACSGRGDDQVAVAAIDLAFAVKVFQHDLLVRHRTDGEG